MCLKEKVWFEGIACFFCSHPTEEAVEPYMPPFYDLVGERPSLDRMRDVVVNGKRRPHIDNSWRNDEASNRFKKLVMLH